MWFSELAHQSTPNLGVRTITDAPQVCFRQTWIQDLLLQDQDQDSEVQDQDQDSTVSTFKTKTKTKTLMSKTKTETQDLQDQYWKSMTGMDCDKQKDWKSWQAENPAYW